MAFHRHRSPGSNSKQQDRDEEGLTGSLTRENFFFRLARCFALSHFFLLARCKKKKEAKGGRKGGREQGSKGARKEMTRGKRSERRTTIAWLPRFGSKHTTFVLTCPQAWTATSPCNSAKVDNSA